MHKKFWEGGALVSLGFLICFGLGFWVFLGGRFGGFLLWFGFFFFCFLVVGVFLPVPGYRLF